MEGSAGTGWNWNSGVAHAPSDARIWHRPRPCPGPRPGPRLAERPPVQETRNCRGSPWGNGQRFASFSSTSAPLNAVVGVCELADQPVSGGSCRLPCTCSISDLLGTDGVVSWSPAALVPRGRDSVGVPGRWRRGRRTRGRVRRGWGPASEPERSELPQESNRVTDEARYHLQSSRRLGIGLALRSFSHSLFWELSVSTLTLGDEAARNHRSLGVSLLKRGGIGVRIQASSPWFRLAPGVVATVTV